MSQIDGGRLESRYHLTMDEPLLAIIDLLREEHGLAAVKLHPSARLAHDLGVDGDDVSDLLQCLHERFGTDFSALDEQWTEFFHHEGASPWSILIGLALMIPSTAITVWIAAMFKLSTSVVGVFGVAIFFALWIGLGWLLPKKRMRPVTIDGLADIVQTGAWPSDAAKVC